jgi:hypothetical protein
MLSKLVAACTQAVSFSRRASTFAFMVAKSCAGGGSESAWAWLIEKNVEPTSNMAIAGIFMAYPSSNGVGCDIAGFLLLRSDLYPSFTKRPTLAARPRNV